MRERERERELELVFYATNLFQQVSSLDVFRDFFFGLWKLLIQCFVVVPFLKFWKVGFWVSSWELASVHCIRITVEIWIEPIALYGYKQYKLLCHKCETKFVQWLQVLVKCLKRKSSRSVSELNQLYDYHVNTRSARHKRWLTIKLLSHALSWFITQCWVVSNNIGKRFS